MKQNLVGINLNRKLYADFGARSQHVLPSESKPVYCYVYNDHDVQGAAGNFQWKQFLYVTPRASLIPAGPHASFLQHVVSSELLREE
jgi:hypothetical protein